MSNIAKKLVGLVGGDGRRETTYNGTVVQIGSTYQVLIDGATEATVCTPEVKAIVGDRVTVEVRNHMATVRGNITHPTTDDAQADAALTQAGIAASAATAAQSSAGVAATAAATAASQATSAAGSASTASQAATTAQQAATAASGAATTAQQAASTALTQMSVIEDVSGTLAWISEHGSYVLTTDTTVQAGTVYFELVSGDYVPIATPDPTANPSQEGWYVLDVTDSQSDYIMAHLAVTSAGLWVLPAGIGQASDEQHAAGYKALFASSGMSVYDGTGAIVANYGSETSFYDGSGNVVAQFGRDGAQVGGDSEAYAVVESGAFSVCAPYGPEGMRLSIGDSAWESFTLGMCAAGESFTIPLAVAITGVSFLDEFPLLPQSMPPSWSVQSWSEYTTGKGVSWDFDKATRTFAFIAPEDSYFLINYVFYKPTMALGYDAQATGGSDMAVGEGTIASRDNQLVVGKYNVADDGQSSGGYDLSTYALIVGNGTDDLHRSNAMAVSWEGGVECGDVISGGTLYTRNGVVVDGHSSATGTLVTANDTISVPHNAGTAIASVTIDEGSWLVEGVVEFAASATGVRAANLNLTGGSTNNSITGCRVNAASSGTTDMPVQWVTKRTSQTTIHLNAYQNSGTVLSVTGYLRAMRIT